jgi:5'(3')-deoxyribonucleotidase
VDIGVDIDNILVNTTECVLEWLAERGAPKKTIQDITIYYLENNYPTEYHMLIKEAFESKYMWKKIRLIEGAYDNLQKLYNDEHSLYFVTSSLPENLRKKIGHLARNLDFFPDNYIWRNTVNIHNKQLLDLDVHIDDFYNNLCGKRHYTSICYNYPWNVKETAKDKSIITANNWDEIYTIISSLNCE